MTVLTEATAPITSEIRSERLASAAASWGERIASAPSSAALTYRVGGSGESSVASRITAGKHTFLVDEPAALAGDDSAASPVEVALGALISCQIVVYRLYAEGLGIPFDEIDIAAEGDLDVRNLFGISDDVRPGFTGIRLVISITGPESQDRYDELRRTVDARCPVLDLFKNPTPVEVTVHKV
jgi:Predicted redox protein, regulator of disulfide bond formation